MVLLENVRVQMKNECEYWRKIVQFYEARRNDEQSKKNIAQAL